MGLILCKEYASLIGAKLSVSSIEQNIEQGIVGTSSFCLSLRSKMKIDCIISQFCNYVA